MPVELKINHARTAEILRQKIASCPILKSNNVVIKDNADINHERCNPLWHGGDVVDIIINGWTFEIRAEGDVSGVLIDKTDGHQIFYAKDKANNCNFGSQLIGYIKTDYELEQALNDEHSKYLIQTEYTNDFVCILTDPDGERHDIEWILNGENLLDAIVTLLDSAYEVLDDFLKENIDTYGEIENPIKSTPLRPSTDHCMRAGHAGCRELARVTGYTLDLNWQRFIDDQHLHCIFYGGPLGAVILPNDWAIVIQARGHVDIYGEDELGNDIQYASDGSHDAAIDSSFLTYVNSDAHYEKLRAEGLLTININNWIDFDYRKPDGTIIDLEEAGIDNKAKTDNVLEIFGHDYILPLIDDLKAYIEANP